jgi:hypothetical protein
MYDSIDKILQAVKNIPDDASKSLGLEFDVKDDGSVDIEWDKNDPVVVAMGCNDWEPNDWSKFLQLCMDSVETDEWTVD